MSNTEDTVQSMISAALHADAPADIIAEIEAALGSEDRWVLNACILSIGHMARRFKTYPADLKARVWLAARTSAHADVLAGTLGDAESDIATFKAEAV